MPIAYIAGLLHETNTFLESPTTLADFQGVGSFGRVVRGDALRDPSLATYPVAGMIDTFEQAGWRVAPGVWSATEPGGLVTAKAFDTLAHEIVDTLRRAGPVDCVCLDLHGAMVAENTRDAEGELIARIRALVGPKLPIVAALDLHGNISEASVASASAMVAYRCYPHTDMRETGNRAAHLAMRLYSTSPAWHKRLRRLPFLMPIYRQTTFVEPCRRLYALLEALEQAEGVASLSLLPGFPLADTPFTGPTVLGFGADAGAVDGAVNRLFDAIMACESDFDVQLLDARDGVARAIETSSQGTVLIADVQDNAGGGGTSDTTWVLEELIRQKAGDALLGLMWDPSAAEAAHKAGVGSRIDIALGGHQLPGHHPVKATFDVEQLNSGSFELIGPMSKGLPVDLGKMALLRHGGVRVVVSSVRTQCHDTAYFRRFGLAPEQHAIVVVKSTNHYRADFQPLVSSIVEIEADGACRMNPGRLPYRELPVGTRLYGRGPAFQSPTQVA
ncbi:MAG: M81 family metallopeptidase [Burkholderiaceae bacterium]|jgi:microcystin degradation protein MlrC|nr:M81 family metallopeptidase [Burkholderiaceae bacterium]